MDPFLDAFSHDTELCLDGRITRKSSHPKGAGGNADVYEGFLDSQKVAIKVVRAFGSSGKRIANEKLFRRLWREYLAWYRLSHPNILDCLGYSYDFSPENSYIIPSLVSPWMANGTVTSYLDDHPDTDRVKLLLGIADGLTYLHTRDDVIVHGDLRAGNILVSDQGVPCLTDFGLSRILGEARGFTTSNEVAGCLRWMSPELLNGSKVSVYSDVWAFGMTMLEILSGEPPYSTIKNDILVLRKITSYQLPSRPYDHRIIDSQMWMICRLCWTPEPTARAPIEDLISMLSLYNNPGPDCKIRFNTEHIFKHSSTSAPPSRGLAVIT